MSTVKFTSTKLAAIGKQGILTPDADGYYELVVGGLNTFNSAGEYYTLEGAKTLFEESSVFMRKIQKALLFGEYRHPAKTPDMTNDDYIRRILTVDEDNVICHFKDIWLDENFGRNNPQHNNPQLVAIMAKLKPYGAKGYLLKESLENSNVNTCFSIRALTKDYYQKGQTYRVLTHICTFDGGSTLEPGIMTSNKYDSPSLESYNEQPISIKQLEKIVSEIPSGIALEANNEIINCLKALKQETKTPLLYKW